MIKYFFCLIFLIPVFCSGQNLPQCDSLVIDCCDFGNDTLIITVSNPTSVLFDYPNFVLFNTNMDTIAKETVTYFGIGQGGQTHTMIVVAPLTLPFTGFLNLYTSFSDSLDCSFAFSIADTATAIKDLQDNAALKIFPNPSSGNFSMQLKKKANYARIRVINMLGEIIQEDEYFNETTIQLAVEMPGVYILEIESPDGFIFREKIFRK